MPRRESQLFGVVIPTRNEGDLLHMTVDNILAETKYPDYELIVIDDGSTDGSCDRYREEDGPVNVVTTRGLGVARARNLGAEVARGKYLAFIDAHCRVCPDWLTLFADALTPPDAGVVGPCFTRLEKPEPRGCGLTWPDYTLEIAWFEPQDVDEPYEVPLTTGACQAFTRANFYGIGRYEEGFSTWGFEDVEICLRAWLLGYRVLGDPRITVAHYFRESRDYEVMDVDVIYNFLRMVYLHFSQARIERVLKAIGPNPYLQEAQERLESSDVYELRAELEAARVHNDNWFFQVFMPHLA